MGSVKAGSTRGGRARRPRSKGERSCPFEPTGQRKRLSESACWTGSTRGSRRARATERNAWSRGARPRRGAPRRDPSPRAPAKIRRRFDSPTGTEVPTKVPKPPRAPTSTTHSRLISGAGSSGTSGTRCAPSATPRRPDITRPSPTRRCTSPTGSWSWTTPTTTRTCWRWSLMTSTSPDWSGLVAARTSAPRRARWRRGWWRWPERRQRGTRVRGWRRRNGPCSRWGASTRRGAIHRRTKKATYGKALRQPTRV
mmetsp:Transcript_7915/g.35924  ORF Transcript_7915/g.35924 Transcript_7915/m.35924 type:complete len:254 (+) Transcript_7915:769-1530(+)